MAQEKKSKVSILTNGIIKENPVLRLVLGTCSCLAVTTAVSSALGMGAAFTFVLVCSNILISLLRNVIPAKVHLPCYIVIIAGFVTIVQMVMHAYMDSLYTALGVFLPLIVVNCIILGRAEMFACKNNVVDSALDGVGMGIGYTLTVVLMATIREVYNSLGVYLPLITTNCCVLAVTILVVDDYGADVEALGFGAAYIEALVCAIGAGVGFMLAMVMFSGVRKRVEACDPPAPFKGLPITLLAAAITSLSFMGFGGIVENLFNVTL